MKNNIKKYLLYMVGGVMALGALTLTSCKDDGPEPTPAEELYLRSFIKKYGLIDPNQDWNQAQRGSVTVIVDKASMINVYATINGSYYRVAAYVDVAGEVEIPVDMPEGCTDLCVVADDSYIETQLGGVADFTRPFQKPQHMPTNQNWVAWIDNWDTTTTVRQDGYENNGAYKTNPGQPREKVSLPTSEYINVRTSAHMGAIPSGSAATITDLGGGYAANRASQIGRIRRNTNIHFYLENPNTAAYQLTFKTAITDNDGAPVIPESGILQLSVVLVDSHGTVYLDKIVDYGETGTSLLEDRGTTVATPMVHRIDLPLLPKGDYQLVLTSITTRGSGHLAGQWGDIQIKQLPMDNLGWLLVAEDLGATDDFDFNDVIIRVESVTTNKASLDIENEWWQVIQDDNQHMVLQAPSRADATYTSLSVQAMCAGGILDSYLHFVTKSNNDFILWPNTSPVNLTTQTPPTYDSSTATEWHMWFDHEVTGTKNHRPMLNTGLTEVGPGKKGYFTVEGSFSLTNYSQIYKDYDGVTDQFGGANGTDFVNNNEIYTAWTYGTDASYHIEGFYITVEGYTKGQCRQIGAPKPGAAPQMFLIPDVGALGLWHWPMERVPITSVYPDFAGWVTSSSNSNWYMTLPPDVANTHEGDRSTAVHDRDDQ